MKRFPVIALLTDFGIGDSYVAAMKAVILSRAPNVSIVDISHDVMPHNIDQAAFMLWSVYKYFPKKTIFVCVVDPGVGSDRNIICLQTNDYFFLAPDNGLLKYIISALKSYKIFSINSSKYSLYNLSSTFHGRDIFAPIATALANKTSPSKLGSKTKLDYEAEEFIEIVPDNCRRLTGKIVHIDHFGNIVTNFLIKKTVPLDMEIQIGHNTIREFSRTYSEAQTSQPFMIVGSSSLLEISVKNGNANKIFKAKINHKINLSIK
jgi:S-adenosylmethionine hydrolase